jgi:hypothetical protein
MISQVKFDAVLKTFLEAGNIGALKIVVFSIRRFNVQDMAKGGDYNGLSQHNAKG